MAGFDVLLNDPIAQLAYGGLVASAPGGDIQQGFGTALGLMLQGEERIMREAQLARQARQDELAREQAELQNAMSKRKLDIEERRMISGVDLPSSVRETQWLLNQPSDVRAMHFKAKRALPRLDLGGSVGFADPISGTPAQMYERTLRPGEQPETMARQESAKVLGKAAGEAESKVIELESLLPNTKTVVQELDELAGKAEYTIPQRVGTFVGTQILGDEPSEGAVARTEYETKVLNNVLPQLKPLLGAAFTAAEFVKVEQTMGDPNVSPQQKQAALKAFIAQAERNLEAAKRDARARGISLQQLAQERLGQTNLINQLARPAKTDEQLQEGQYIDLPQQLPMTPIPQQGGAEFLGFE